MSSTTVSTAPTADAAPADGPDAPAAAAAASPALPARRVGDSAESLLKDTAALLYRRGALALAGAAAVALLLCLGVEALAAEQAPWPWLGALLVVLGVRLVHTLHWLTAARPAAPQVLVRQFGAGALATAALWAALPWLHFEAWPAAARLLALLAAAGMVGTALPGHGRLPRLALAHNALVVLPASAWLLLHGGPAEQVAAALGLLCFGAAALAIHWAHGALRAAFRTAKRASVHTVRENRRLHDAQARSERELQRLSAQLSDTQAELESTQRDLAGQDGAGQDERSRELALQVITDPLTALPNRKGLNEHLGQLMDTRGGLLRKAQLALLFLDLDHFKEVNDVMGHLAGDSVLCTAAERLREAMPRGAFAARWGGDEFVVVLPGMRRAEQAKAVAEQLRATLSVPIRVQGREARIGCSIGIALAPQHGDTPEALVIAADHAVYSAKHEGLGRVRLFDAALAQQAGRHHDLSQALPAALELGHLQLVYQPIVEADGQATTHVEALARWRHPLWGAVPPGEFIGVAESSGLILTLGRWVLRQACHDAARWPGSAPPKVSVNVSALQVTSGHLVTQVREALTGAGLPAQRLVIELTESLPMAGRDSVSETLSELRAMGVQLAIDDFGTGYSSLSTLMKQPVNLVKIDQSLVREVPGEGELLIKATVDVARCFALEVVAEGVETLEQQRRLQALGVHYLQGFLFARPLPNLEFVAWLGEREDISPPVALRI